MDNNLEDFAERSIKISQELGCQYCDVRSENRLSNGFVIENGEVVAAGKPVRIVHNLPILLESISGIANNEKNVLQWASLPSITPSIKAEGIRVNPI